MILICPQLPHYFRTLPNDQYLFLFKNVHKTQSKLRQNNTFGKLTCWVFLLNVAGCGRHPRSRYEHRDDDSRVGRHRRGEGAPSGWGRRGRARPFFDDSASSGNITLIEGQTAMMECVVKHVGNKSVSQSDRGGNSRFGRQSIIRLFNAVSSRQCTAEATF